MTVTPIEDVKQELRGFRQRAAEEPALDGVFEVVNVRMREWLEGWEGPNPPTQYQILRHYARLCKVVADELEDSGGG